MEDKIDWKDEKISHKGMKRKISELEARIVELEKRPQAKYCELCGHTTFQKFVPFRCGKLRAKSLKYVLNVLDLKAETWNELSKRKIGKDLGV